MYMYEYYYKIVRMYHNMALCNRSFKNKHLKQWCSQVYLFNNKHVSCCCSPTSTLIRFMVQLHLNCSRVKMNYNILYYIEIACIFQSKQKI